MYTDIYFHLHACMNGSEKEYLLLHLYSSLFHPSHRILFYFSSHTTLPDPPLSLPLIPPHAILFYLFLFSPSSLLYLSLASSSPYSALFYLFLSSCPTLPSSSIFNTAASELLHSSNNLLILLLFQSISADNLVFLSLSAHCTPPLFSQFQPVFIDYLFFRLPKDDDIGVDIIKAINGKIF